MGYKCRNGTVDKPAALVSDLNEFMVFLKVPLVSLKAFVRLLVPCGSKKWDLYLRLLGFMMHIFLLSWNREGDSVLKG